jgi:hypothetical protein
VYDPTNAWPVIRRTRVAHAVRMPFAAPAMAGGSFPDGGDGRAKKACERLSSLCHLACQAERANSLVLDLWNAMVLGSEWSGGHEAAALARARSMQRRKPAIEASEGHHSSLTRVDLEREKISVSDERNSREKDWPAWGRRFVMAWMAARFVEYIVAWWEGC